MILFPQQHRILVNTLEYWPWNQAAQVHRFRLNCFEFLCASASSLQSRDAGGSDGALLTRLLWGLNRLIYAKDGDF